MTIALGVFALILGAIRIAGVKSIFYQAIAHVYVGGLFGAWIGAKPKHRECLALAFALTVLEVLCFLADRALHMFPVM